MKTIQCDLCKRILGKTVDVGKFTSISHSEYRPMDFNVGMFLPNNGGKTIVDVCSECCNKVIEAQNKVIKEIVDSVKE